MRAPVLEGRIERRVLLDHAVDTEVAARLLPSGFEPRLLDGRAVVGVCLIRLADVRPVGMPAWLGRSVEAAAHRVSVWREGPDGPEAGVYVPRRDTTSWAATMAGGRVWPGVHHRAAVTVRRSAKELSVEVRCRDGQAVAVAVDLAERAHLGVRLADAAAASAFHAVERIAWSPGRDGSLEAADLLVHGWAARPVGVLTTASTWVDDPRRFPPGTSTLAGALLMEDVPVTWSTPAGGREDVATCPVPAATS